MMERGCREERRVVPNERERDVMEMKRGDRAERKKVGKRRTERRKLGL